MRLQYSILILIANSQIFRSTIKSKVEIYKIVGFNILTYAFTIHLSLSFTTTPNMFINLPAKRMLRNIRTITLTIVFFFAASSQFSQKHGRVKIAIDKK